RGRGGGAGRPCTVPHPRPGTAGAAAVDLPGAGLAAGCTRVRGPGDRALAASIGLWAPVALPGCAGVGRPIVLALWTWRGLVESGVGQPAWRRGVRQSRR